MIICLYMHTYAEKESYKKKHAWEKPKAAKIIWQKIVITTCVSKHNPVSKSTSKGQK